MILVPARRLLHRIDQIAQRLNNRKTNQCLGLLGFVQPNLFGILPLGGYDIWIHLITGAILTFAGFSAAAPRNATT